jgi:hypothetical protein
MDAAGNIDPTPASFTWTIDLTAPETTITDNPPPSVNSTAASFSFISDEGGSTFECSLDGASFASCASPANYAGLGLGSHTFQVRAIDAVGNIDPTPAIYTWVVDGNAPDTTITTNPPALTNSTSASFAFTSTEAGSTFECNIDGSAFASCTSPQNYTSLAEGSHTFQVGAIDPAGNLDPTPASFTWTINTTDTTPPFLTNFVVNTPIVSTGNGPGTFRATLHAQDDQSGVETAGLSIQSPSGFNRLGNCTLIGGTPPNATFECTLNLPQFSEAGTWFINVSVRDVAGNGPRAYTSTELASLGFASTFSVSAQPTNTITAQLPAGLVSWWDADFVSGAAALDLGSGIHGTLVNGAAVASGKVGKAFSFDGVDDSIDVPDSNALDLTTRFTLSAWINPSSPQLDPAQGAIISKIGGGGGNNGYQFGLTGLNGVLYCQFNASGEQWPTNSLAVNLPNPIAVGQWSHVACTYDNADLQIYVNGLLAGSMFVGLKNVVNSTSTLRISGDDNSNGFFHGLIDEVQIYNRALSQAEVQSVFAADSAGVSKVRNRIYWSEDDKLRTANVETSAGQTPSTRTDIEDLLVGQPACCGRDLVLDEAGGDMYWTNTDNFTFGIRRGGIDIPAGQTASNRTDVEFLVPGQMFGMALDLADSKMYWTQTFNGNVRRSNLDIPAGQNANNRTDIEDLVVGESINRRGIALDRTAGKMYFVDGDGGRIQRSNFDGSNLEHLVTGLGSYGPVALDLDLANGKIYFTVPNKIQRANLDGSNVEDFVILPAPPYGLALDLGGQKLYWGTGGGGNADKIQRANIQIPAGETAPTRTDVEDVVSGLNGVTGLALGFTPLAASLDTVPPDTTITVNPTAVTNSTDANFEFSSNEAGSTFECSLDGNAFSSCGSPQNFNSLAEGSHMFQVRATDPAGNQDTTPASYAWTITTADITPPETTITGSPAALTNATTASFTFIADEAGSTFQCRLDAAAFAGCTSPRNYTGLAAGTHTFEVRATDAANNTDPSPANYTWTIDRTAPNTTITSGPPTPTNITDAAFTFDSTEPGSTFQCRLDGAAFAPCTSPVNYTALSNGSHTFRVRAIDPAGNTDGSPAAFTWNIDLTAPNTNITGNPGAASNSPSATFTFTASQANSTFACSLDSAPFAPCSSPATYNGLADGSHNFLVQATDPAGNTDATPAVFNWIVDTVVPDTTINSTPPLLSGSPSASFTFSSNEAGALFQCSLDGAAFTNCNSPRNYSGLADGPHTFQVRARDAAGNIDQTPASYSWTVDDTAPIASITSGPPTPTNVTSATFTFISNDPTATFQCRLDGAAFAACTSPVNLTGLTNGNRNFRVRAIDPAGNIGPVALYTWNVDTTAPNTNITGNPGTVTTNTSATFTFTASQANSTFECNLDGAGFTGCTSPATYNGFTLGGHNFQARAIDPAGNTDPTPANFNWTIQ